MPPWSAMRGCLRLVGQAPPESVAASPSAGSQMEKGKPSRTAEFVAAVRAAHLLYDRPLLFEDPFALQLTSVTWRAICENRLLHWLVMKKILGALRPLHGQILARSRYAEDQLDKAISAGVRQYVLIGAGLDSFALRRQDVISSLKVYELDHPATQMRSPNISRQRSSGRDTSRSGTTAFVQWQAPHFCVYAFADSGLGSLPITETPHLFGIR